MNDNTLPFAVSFLGVLIVAIMAGSILYGCEKSGERYHDLASQCIHNSGSWVPTVGEGNAVCLNVRPASTPVSP